MRLCWSHMPHCLKSHALAQLVYLMSYRNDSWRGYDFNLNVGGFVLFFMKPVHQSTCMLLSCVPLMVFPLERRQSKTVILSTNVPVNQKSLETEISIAIQSKTLFLEIFDC